MRIGIIGSGHIGGTLGRGLAAAGHEIMFAARDVTKLQALRDETGAAIGTPQQAANFAEVLIVATPYGAWPALAATLGPLLGDRIVIDAANPYPDRDGAMARDALDRGSGVTTAALIPEARVVKGFNTLFWRDLAEKGGQGFGIAIAGDHVDAVDAASLLVRDMGFDPVAAGGLTEARRFDPGQPAYGAALTPDALREKLASANQGERP